MVPALPAPFGFDLDLSGNPRQTQVMTEKKLADLREAAYRDGFAKGLAEGERNEVARTNTALARAAERLAADAATLLKAIDASDRQALADALVLARAVGRKLANTLIAAQPEAELDRLIEECLASLERTPHLVVRCAPALTDKVKQITEAHIASAGYAGRLIVLGDAAIGTGDGRIEWADGGLVRDMGAILAEIDRAIAAYCATEGLPAPDFPPDRPAETADE